MSLTIDVYMRSRTKTFFKGSATTVTTLNAAGELDILPMHTNFVSIIQKYVIIDKALKSEQKFEIDSAVISVLDGKVDIYVGI